MSDTFAQDTQGRRIHIPGDRRRIDGLVAEEKARTLTLFRPGNYAEHPTAPIDIAPFHDALQGLGTHIKSFLQDRTARQPDGFTTGTLELASTLELMRLAGHHRYIALAYEIDGEIEIDGKIYKIRRYHTAIEAIFSPDTFSALRGTYTLEHLAWIQRRLDACTPTHETIKDQQDRFKKLMKQFSNFFGIARPSVKLSINSKTGKIDNRRVQSSIPLQRVQEQLAKEGPYHGRFIQPNYREWYEGETFYGMELPWFTINSDHIFSTIGDPDVELDERAVKEMRKRHDKRAASRVIAPPAPPASSIDDQRYASEEPISTKLLAFDGGMLAIVRQQDDARTISVQAVDKEAFRRANAACERLGARWLAISGRWLTDLPTAQRIVQALGAAIPSAMPGAEQDHVDPLPPVPATNPLTPNPKNDRLFYFDVSGRKAAAYCMKPHGNWALMDQGNPEVAAIIDGACAPYAPLKPWDGRHDGDWAVRYNADKRSWLVREVPADLIQRVVCAIQRYRP